MRDPDNPAATPCRAARLRGGVLTAHFSNDQRTGTTRWIISAY
jgi:hypothetical protein